MALKLHASADTRVELVLCCDESISDNNTTEALQAYRETGDMKSLTIPDEAERVFIRPLNTPTWQAVFAAAPLPRGILPPGGIIEDGEILQEKINAHLEGLNEEEQLAATSDIDAWHTQMHLAMCEFGLESITALPDVKPVTRGGLRRFPREELERIPFPAIAEISEAISRVSQMGKADSSP
jgi:hypothetical protein